MMLTFRDIAPILIPTLALGVAASVMFVITSPDRLAALLSIGGGIAGLAAVLGLWWLKCEIQDRIHARQTVAKWDQIVAMRAAMNEPGLLGGPKRGQQ